MAQRGWQIHLNRCIGCGACSMACKAENNTYPRSSAEVKVDKAGRIIHTSYRWVVKKESGYYPQPKCTFVTMACNHCEHPACLAACPLSDINDPSNENNVIVKRSSDGVVLINQETCIGCKYCMGACPYGAPQFNPVTGKVEKCTFCNHRVEKGFLPACVQTCVGRALDVLDDFSGQTSGANAPDGFAPSSMTKPSVAFDND
ncbi:MAG: dimethylsulfoxide reductase subunit B [Myxococcota bacterium]